MESSNPAQPNSAPSGIQIQIGGNVDNSAVNVAGGDLHVGTPADAYRDPDNSATPPPSEEQLALYRDLTAKFTLEELEGVSWELGIRFEELPAKTLSGKARQLIEKAGSLGLNGRLREIVARERPT